MENLEKELEKELRKEFQLERMILFTDAVFAIAITLLVIELKVPEIHEIHENFDHEIGMRLAQMIPKFIGFFISFFVIGQYWTVHHRLFGYLHDYNTKLLWANLFYLLGIILLPFSTAFFSEFFMFGSKIPFLFYLLNILFLASMNTRLWRIIANPDYKLSKINRKTNFVKYYIMRSYMVPVIFTLSFLLSFINVWLGTIILMLMPFYGLLIKRYFKNKYNFEPERRH